MSTQTSFLYYIPFFGELGYLFSFHSTYGCKRQAVSFGLSCPRQIKAADPRSLIGGGWGGEYFVTCGLNVRVAAPSSHGNGPNSPAFCLSDPVSESHKNLSLQTSYLIMVIALSMTKRVNLIPNLSTNGLTGRFPSWLGRPKLSACCFGTCQLG